MEKVVCHTNLDLRGERWPSELPKIPNVGDEIESSTDHFQQNYSFRLSLEVCKVRYRQNHNDEYVAHVELHLPNRFRSINDFYEWYAPLVGSTKGSFI